MGNLCRQRKYFERDPGMNRYVDAVVGNRVNANNGFTEPKQGQRDGPVKVRPRNVRSKNIDWRINVPQQREVMPIVTCKSGVRQTAEGDERRNRSDNRDPYNLNVIGSLKQ